MRKAECIKQKTFYMLRQTKVVSTLNEVCTFSKIYVDPDRIIRRIHSPLITNNVSVFNNVLSNINGDDAKQKKNYICACAN